MERTRMLRWQDVDMAQLRNILLFAIAYFSFALRFWIFPLRLIRFIAHTMIIVWFIAPSIRVVVCVHVRHLIDYVRSLILVHLLFSVCCGSNSFHPNHLWNKNGKMHSQPPSMERRGAPVRSWTLVLCVCVSWHDDDYRNYIVAYGVVLALTFVRYRHICRQIKTEPKRRYGVPSPTQRSAKGIKNNLFSLAICTM